MDSDRGPENFFLVQRPPREKCMHGARVFNVWCADKIFFPLVLFQAPHHHPAPPPPPMVVAAG